MVVVTIALTWLAHPAPAQELKKVRMGYPAFSLTFLPVKDLQDIYDQAYAAQLIPTPVPAAKVMDYTLTDEALKEKK